MAADDRYAALYLRVSSAGQKDNWSVKDQLGLARLAPGGLRVVVFDGDLGISGETIEARPDMTRLLAEIKAERVAAVICADWNRLSRDQDLLDAMSIKAACRDAGTVVVTPGKTYDFETDADDMLGVMEALFAANQNKARTKATTRGQYTKAREGGWVGGQAPFGYRLVFDLPHRDGRLRGRLEVHPEEAEVVRECFLLYADGTVGEDGRWRPLSQQGVAAELNRRGRRFRERAYRDATKRKHPQGRAFGPMDVMRIVTSRRYLGYVEWGRTQTSRHVRDLGAAEVRVDALRIVDAGLFLRAQTVREERRRQPARLGCPTRPLQGLLRCPHCGARTVGQSQSARGGARERVVRYHCLAFKHYGASPDGGCPAGGYSVAEPLALAAVDGLLAGLFARLELGRALDEATAEARAADTAGLEARLRAGLEDVALGRKNLVDAVAAGDLRGADVRAKRDELEATEERLRGRLEGLRGERMKRDELTGLAQAVRGQPLAGALAHLQAEDPARYRRLVGLFYEAITLEGEGPSRRRVVRVSEARPPVLTVAARRLVSDYRSGPLDSTLGTSVLAHVPEVQPLLSAALGLLCGGGAAPAAPAG